ncbi:hypothetical protein H1D32_13160 [Anaerobacillus sp. CMMVII]|uniref:hypothetical protein n=1 Tax=Anaerobacillus sp. CMMVII TaxID=2755588 RepID=UPI0021B71F18|nr:hypothetical protein [Anaerobacillus sp. CMMVII]MCT8138605.1 hypothetical protein [Anaerobacillus sp. CMMVII]
MEKNDFNNVKGFSKLTVEQQKLFRRVYNSHLKMMGTEFRKKYLPEQLKKLSGSLTKTVFMFSGKGKLIGFIMIQGGAGTNVDKRNSY